MSKITEVGSDQENGSFSEAVKNSRIEHSGLQEDIETITIREDDNEAIIPLISKTGSISSERRESRERLLRKSFDKNFIDREAEPCEEGQGKICEVCYYEYYEEDFFELKCGHSFCVNCVADHLRISIESGNAMKLPCMQKGCKLLFGPE